MTGTKKRDHISPCAGRSSMSRDKLLNDVMGLLCHEAWTGLPALSLAELSCPLSSCRYLRLSDQTLTSVAQSRLKLKGFWISSSWTLSPPPSHPSLPFIFENSAQNAFLFNSILHCLICLYMSVVRMNIFKNIFWFCLFVAILTVNFNSTLVKASCF